MYSIKSTVLTALFLLVYGCHEEDTSRMIEIYDQCHQIIVQSKNWESASDSIIRQAATFPPAGRYAITYKIADFYFKYGKINKGLSYLRTLDSIPFPKIQDKTSSFLLLRQHADNGLIRKFAPQYLDFQKLSILLFNMENRQQLTPTEKCRLLTYKANIYNCIFKEKEVAIALAHEAERFALQHHIIGEPLLDIYYSLINNYLTFDSRDTAILMTHNFQAILENTKCTWLTKNNTYSLLFALYFKQKNYPEAYYWMKKAGTDTSQKYKHTVAQLYLLLDSIPAMEKYIEKYRPGIPAGHSSLGDIAWIEANAALRRGDTLGYRQHLEEAVNIFDRYRSEPYQGITSEAYARLLWQQGKTEEAIHRMELLTNKHLLNINGKYASSHNINLENTELELKQFRLLINYYREAGRSEDALRQALLVDSLQNMHAQARLQAERNKAAKQVYTKELQRNLDLQATELLKEQQRLRIIYLLLAIAIMGIAVLLHLYYRHRKQIDILYTRQKEIEYLQEEKREIAINPSHTPSPDEQLFHQLEKQFYKEQLFLNPDFSRDDLCRLGGSNRMYVSTCINKYAGTNINQWINKARTDYAIKIICQGETNLQVIAETSGFSSTTSFFRNFKQFTNLTPRQYIERQKLCN